MEGLLLCKVPRISGSQSGSGKRSAKDYEVGPAIFPLGVIFF